MLPYITPGLPMLPHTVMKDLSAISHQVKFSSMRVEFNWNNFSVPSPYNLLSRMKLYKASIELYLTLLREINLARETDGLANLVS